MGILSMLMNKLRKKKKERKMPLMVQRAHRYIFHIRPFSQDVKGKNCAFYDKRTKLCMFVGLYVLNNFGYRGIAEKSYNRNKPV